MENLKYIDEIASVLAFIFSIFALWISIRRQIKTRTQEGAAEALAAFATLEQMIKDVPDALEFHGIKKEALQIANISTKQLSYFLSNMTTGGIYCRTTEKVGLIKFFDKKKVGHIEFFDSEEGYYGRMFKQEATRNAWAICRCCIAQSAYRKKLDKLSEINEGPSKDLVKYLEENNK